MVEEVNKSRFRTRVASLRNDHRLRSTSRRLVLSAIRRVQSANHILKDEYTTAKISSGVLHRRSLHMGFSFNSSESFGFRFSGTLAMYLNQVTHSGL